jgi:hypothetical protein
MIIPSRHLERFVREVTDQCFVSLTERSNRGVMFQNYADCGAQDPADAAIFNKTFSYLDDLESLLYSPLSLRFHIGDPEIPNVVDEAKGKAASARLRGMARKTDTDTMISAAVKSSLVKGKSFIKQMFKRGEFAPELVSPESMGVFRESHDKLDEDMEAFAHRTLITPYQFNRLIWNHPDKTDLEKKSKNYMRDMSGDRGDASSKNQIVVGGMYPFQPAGSGSPNQTRGIVDWMSSPRPDIDPKLQGQMLELDELWVWDDKRQNWATFQIIGSDMLIYGKYQIANAFSFNMDTQSDSDVLKGHHPFNEFCVNPVEGYFWGRSEIANVALLQEAINARINGTNRLLRKQEDPPTKFVGGTGVNQLALSRFNKPGGYWVDSSPNAKIDRDQPQIPSDLWGSLHEYERMFDEMGGLPPTARGHGEAGVRSQAHAETLIRMFSPRFKDRALLVERQVASLGGIMLDLARAHVDKKLTAWVPDKEAGAEKSTIINPLIPPPAPGLVPVQFTFADLDDDVTLSVDSHSSSPAFSQEANQQNLTLVKLGAMSPEDYVEHSDSPDPEELTAGIQRRAHAQAEQQAKVLAIKAQTHAKK